MIEVDIEKKFSNGIKQNLIGTILKHGVTFIVSIFLSRLLPPAEFGKVGMATVFISFTQSLSNMGLSSGIIREKELLPIQLNTVFYFNLSVSVLLCIILFFTSDLIGYFYNSPDISLIVKAISGIFIINSLNTVQSALFYRNLEIKTSRVASVYGAICSGLIGILMAFTGYGVWSLVATLYVSSVVSTLYIWKKSTWRPRFEFCFTALKKLFPFGFRVFLIEYIDQVYSKLDVFLIGKFFNPVTLGYYFRALSLNELITSYTSKSLSGLYFPAIKKFNNDLEKIFDFFKQTLDVLSFIIFTLTGLLFINAHSLINILFGEDWEMSVSYFRIISFVSLFYPLTIVFNGVLLGTDNSKMQLALEITKKIIGLLAIFIGLQYGMEQYLFLTVFVNLIGVVITFIVISKVLNKSFISASSAFFKYMIPLLISIACVEYMQTKLDPMLNLFLGIPLYSSMFLFFFISICYVLKINDFKKVLQKLKYVY